MKKQRKLINKEIGNIEWIKISIDLLIKEHFSTIIQKPNIVVRKENVINLISKFTSNLDEFMR